MSSPESGAAMRGEEPVPPAVEAGVDVSPGPGEAPTANDLADITPELEAGLPAPIWTRGHTRIDLKAFHEELRRANLPLLFWTVAVFDVAYLAWGVFDYSLAPTRWKYFLALRVIAAALNALTVFVLYRPALRRYTWEAFWIVAFVFGGFIAPMLPQVADSYPAYVMGFSIVIFGSGLLPSWPPKWAISAVTAILGSGFLAFVLVPSNVSERRAGQPLLRGNGRGHLHCDRFVQV